ncbi:MAG: valine--tRNA ligase [Elusimicrobiota bacterium]
MEIEIPKTYEPLKTEEKWYQFWIENSLFSSVPREGSTPFTIVIPPPNVTGSLHMGHALNGTLQDIIIRFRRMQNFNALWVPGTDHGGIATQNIVEKVLLSEGKTRHDLGREKFMERMWQWRKESGDTILMQLKRLGCSLDWNRTRFTMDDVCSKAVMTAFVELYNKGLIYRGKRLVNWCPRCKTALSDIEVEHEEEIGKLWHIKYPLKKDKKTKSAKTAKSKKAAPADYITVATTRPETMLGDTAVAVNPKDKRYKALTGKTIILPLMGREIPVVADQAVDKTFGTGAVKVTPAHDPTDFEIGYRHKLLSIEVIGPDGKMTKEAGEYAGLDRYAARKKILQDLEEQGLLLETADHPHSIGHCYRCDTVIEPLLSEQWFLKVGDMSKKAMKVVVEGKVKFYPESWAKPYLLWLENLRDWCISRQIWWGHRIPVYYCSNVPAFQSSKDKNKKPDKKTKTKTKTCKPIASITKPEKCPCCGGKVEQDPDVLDTWFSSALWPFSVFGWPAEAEGSLKKEEGSKDKSSSSVFHLPSSDLSYYYPTSVLVTGHEILYLWVARMVQMGIEFMGDIPFKEVLITGMVRDKTGKKMSKSLGNVIDPLVVMEKYGTDALRFALTQSAAPGRDMQLSDDNFTGARNFANKIWNASRFVMMYLQSSGWDKDYIMAIWPLELADKWILSEYRVTVRKVTVALEKYDLDVAARELYDFFWSKYCDWYIELAKIRLNGADEKAKKAVLSVLIEILSGVARLLHPIMPFITEEIWNSYIQVVKSSGKGPESIMNAPWPQSDESKIDAGAVSTMNLLQQVITAVRTIRSEMNVPPQKNIDVIISASPAKQDIIRDNVSYLKFLARIEKADFGENIPRPKQSASAVVSGIEIFVPLAGLIDLEKEKQRLAKELQNAEMEIERCKKNLANENFVQRAPKAEVDKFRVRQQEAQVKIERIKETLKSLA